MPRDKKDSHERVIKAAKEEFLSKGFEKASMRSIGEKAGMTCAGLYRHYKNKEDMFDALVKPALDLLKDWYKEHKKSRYELIDKNAGKKELFSSTVIDFVKDILYKNKDEFKLLFTCAQGTKYENFLHDMVKLQQEDMLEAMSYMKKKGANIKLISREEMHLIMSAYVTALMEPFIHNMDIEKTANCIKTVEEFFMPGWQKIMGY